MTSCVSGRGAVKLCRKPLRGRTAAASFARATRVELAGRLKGLFIIGGAVKLGIPRHRPSSHDSSQGVGRWIIRAEIFTL